MRGRSARPAGRHVVVVVAVAALLGPATAASAQSASPGAEVVLRVGTTADLSNENPFGATAGSDWMVATAQYDMLLRFSSEDLSPAPGVAEGCEPSADHTVWTCRIRDGVRWSDGEPLTARDVAFSFRFVIDNKIPQYRSYFPYRPTFETPDDHTLIWRSQQPTFAPELPPFVYIVPEHVWADYDGADRKAIRSAPNVPAVASGPFVLTGWTRGQGWTMERNPEFWGPEPAVDRVEFRLFSNQEAMVQALRNGEIDVADGIQPSLFGTLEGAPNVATQQTVSDWWLNLAFNFGGQGDEADPHPALADHTVRQAIAMAIDKREIVDKVYLGYATRGDTVIREASAYWHLDIPEDDEYPFDPARAAALLEQAGYVDSDGDGVREDPATGTPLSLRMPASDETTGAVEAGQLIAGYLREIGIRAELRAASDSKMNDYWGAGDFDLYLWYWSGDPDPDYQLSVFTSGLCGVWSDGCWSDPAFDRMYEEQREIFDREQRRQAVFIAQRYLYEQIPGIVLAYPKSLQAYRSDRFTGWTPAPGEDGYLLPAYNYESLVTVRPVTAGPDGAPAPAPSSPGFPAWVWVAAVGAVLAVIAVTVARGRRDRELEA
jgi:peptide/nickel transport system substrate-binding protein